MHLVKFDQNLPSNFQIDGITFWFNQIIYQTTMKYEVTDTVQYMCMFLSLFVNIFLFTFSYSLSW